MGKRVRKLSLVWLAAVALAPFAFLQSGRSQAAWPHERSALKQDDRVLWGELPNGFRYAILPKNDQKGGVSMRFSVDVGSLRETENESGYAHLIEHLAFEGAGDFSGEAIEKLFRDVGLSVGDDVNGFTTHQFTSYRLELPDGADELSFGKALQLYRGFADGIHFEETSVGKQKAIVLAEKLRGNTPLALFDELAFEQAMRGTLYTGRPIIGSTTVIEDSSREDLKKFYEKWYRPDLMTLFVVGEVDVDKTISEIESHFGSLQSPSRKGFSQNIGDAEEEQTARSTLFRNENLDRALIDLSRAWSEPRGRDSERLRERDFLRLFATELLNERIQRFVGVFDSDFVFYESRYRLPYAHARLTTSKEKWLTGLTLLDRMIRQGTRHGFYDEEINSLRDRWLKRLGNRLALSDSASSAMIVDSLEQETMQGRVYLSPKDNHNLERDFLHRLDNRELTRALRDCWKSTGMSVVVGGGLPENTTSRRLNQDFASYRRVGVEPYDYESRRAVTWNANSGEGKLTNETEVEGVDDAILVEFENETQLTYLNTKNEKGFANVLVRLSPRENTPDDFSNPAIRSIALDSLLWSGVSGYNWEEIHQEISARVFDFSYSIEGADNLCFRARCDSSEIDWLLKTIASFVENGSVSESGFAFAKTNMLRALHVELDGIALAKQRVQRSLFPNRPDLWDPQLGEGYDLQQEEVQRWLEQRMSSGRIEVVVVGDVPERIVRSSVAGSFGALKREDGKERPAVKSQTAYPKPGYDSIVYPNGQGRGALAISNWILRPGPSSFKNRVALTFAEQILRERIVEKTRKQMAASYDAKVDYWSFSSFPEFQRFRIEADCSSENLTSVLNAIEEACLSMSIAPPLEEELERVKASLRSRYANGEKDNQFLLENVIYSVSEHPEWIDEWVQLEKGLLDEIDGSRVQEVCRRWLKWEDAVVAGVEPKDSDS